MPLSPGTKLGPYEILSPIGAGGMGEVLRARDPRLGRDVAIKVLPAAMSTDPDRLARFQREARAVAALNHPHIVTIYSVEEGGSIHFLTMELVEGKPLDRIIPAHGLPADQIVDIGNALADALSAAHDKGIVHRDLKPPTSWSTTRAASRCSILASPKRSPSSALKMKPAPPQATPRPAWSWADRKSVV